MLGWAGLDWGRVRYGEVGCGRVGLVGLVELVGLARRARSRRGEVGWDRSGRGGVR